MQSIKCKIAGEKGQKWLKILFVILWCYKLCHFVAVFLKSPWTINLDAIFLLFVEIETGQPKIEFQKFKDCAIFEGINLSLFYIDTHLSKLFNLRR